MKLGSKLTQGHSLVINTTTPTGVVNTAAMHAKCATQLGSWIPLAQRLNQRY